jgi:hypothetical protein
MSAFVSPLIFISIKSTNISEGVHEKSTYGTVREALANRYGVQDIMVLQAVYGQRPYWIASDSESTIEPTCRDLYAVILREPRRFSLSVVRTALFDYPMAICKIFYAFYLVILIPLRCSRLQKRSCHNHLTSDHHGTAKSCRQNKIDNGVYRQLEWERGSV